MGDVRGDAGSRHKAAGAAKKEVPRNNESPTPTHRGTYIHNNVRSSIIHIIYKEIAEADDGVCPFRRLK